MTDSAPTYSGNAEVIALNNRLRTGGGITAFVMLCIFIGGYFAFLADFRWQRFLMLPALFVVTFPAISFVMRNAMYRVLKPLYDVLEREEDWSNLGKQEEERVLKCIAWAPWGMAINSVLMWVTAAPAFLWLTELMTPGPRHSFVDVAIAFGVCYPAIYIINLLRGELVLRPYMARARAQMKSKDFRTKLVINVQQRLMLATALIGPYSIFVFAVLTYRQMQMCRTVPEALQHFVSLQAFFLAISGLLAWLLAIYLMRVLKQPLDQIKASLSGEAAEAPNSFDEFGVIQQLLVERKALEKAKQDFFAVISHELRSPLMAIESFLRLLADGIYGDVPERVRKKSEAAVSNADRLLRLVNDILDAEKLQSGKFECYFAPTTVESVVDRAVQSVSELAEKQSIPIVVDSCVQNIVCDEERMVQVLINFLTNAIKNADGKPVTISAIKEGESIEFGVRDQGPGIPAEMQETVFEKFRQLKQENAGKQKKGTGLGLPIAKALVEQHGGAIGVIGEPGKGSYFYARIPIEQPKPLLHAIS